jgi:hypothetical protein
LKQYKDSHGIFGDEAKSHDATVGEISLKILGSELFHQLTNKEAD